MQFGDFEPHLDAERGIEAQPVDAAALARDYELTWLAVEKEVDGRRAVQFEHLVGELTRFVSCAFLEVEREGDDARFQPIKTPDDLVSEVPLIARALRARGVL